MRMCLFNRHLFGAESNAARHTEDMRVHGEGISREKHNTIAAVFGPTPLNFVNQVRASFTDISLRNERSKLPRSSVMDFKTR